MDANGQDWAGRFADASERELLGFARGYEGLTEAAQGALRAEFARRGMEAPLIEEDDDGEAVGLRRLVTVRRYRDMSEAIVARSLLEASGIVVYLRDENTVRMDWQISNFLGGMRLQVEEKDVAAATELLNQPVADAMEFGGFGEYEQPRCPECDSAEITFEGASRGAALASVFLLGVPLPLGAETWSCAGCGARWEDAGKA